MGKCPPKGQAVGTDALLSLLLMIFPHMALAPFVRGLDPILGLDEPTPEQPAFAVRRLVAVLADAFSPLPHAGRCGGDAVQTQSRT